jgi:hypothetical protein
MSERVTSALTVAGIVCVGVFAFIVWAPFALLVAGVALIAAGELG